MATLETECKFLPSVCGHPSVYFASPRHRCVNHNDVSFSHQENRRTHTLGWKPEIGDPFPFLHCKTAKENLKSYTKTVFRKHLLYVLANPMYHELTGM